MRVLIPGHQIICGDYVVKGDVVEEIYPVSEADIRVEMWWVVVLFCGNHVD